MKPEEGAEKLDMAPDVYDPMALNVKKLEREIRNELKNMHLERPEVAAKQAEFLFSKDTEVDWGLSQPPIPMD